MRSADSVLVKVASSCQARDTSVLTAEPLNVRNQLYRERANATDLESHKHIAPRPPPSPPTFKTPPKPLPRLESPLSITAPDRNLSPAFPKPEMSSFLLRRAVRTSARPFSTSAGRSSFAKMTIVGRLADTPELQATSTGQEILKYAVGTNSGPRDNQKTSWFRVTSFLPEGPQRDFIASLDKGYVGFSVLCDAGRGSDEGWCGRRSGGQ